MRHLLHTCVLCLAFLHLTLVAKPLPHEEEELPFPCDACEIPLFARYGSSPLQETLGNMLLAQRALHVFYTLYPESREPPSFKDLMDTTMRIVHATHKVLAPPRFFPKELPAKTLPLLAKRDRMQEILRAREALPFLRKNFFARHGLEDRGQKILLYTGSWHKAYFSAFAEFCKVLGKAIKDRDLSSYVLVFQQHPKAKKENRDGILFEKLQRQVAGKRFAPTLLFSSLTLDQALPLSDGVIYYQTNLAPLFARIGMATLQLDKKPGKELVTALEAMHSNKKRFLPSDKAIRELAGYLGIAEEENLVAATQKHWKRASSQERWEMVEKWGEGERAYIFNWAQKEGLLHPLLPRFQNYDAAALLGATTKRMENRLAYLVQLWERGVRFQEVVWLTGMRPLQKGVDDFCDLCETEAEAAKLIWERATLPEEMRTLSVTFINAPRKENGARPTTEDTLVAWKQKALPSHILFVSDQPFCQYQGAIIEGSLSKEISFDIVGEGVRDIEKQHPAAASIILDSIARTLYQNEKNTYGAVR